MRNSRLLYLITYVLCGLIQSNTVLAQVWPARQYTSKDELANSNVYDVMHDDKGYLWFATERGVSRFDGYKFTNYLFKDGLNGSIVYGLTSDAKGSVYAGTKNHGVYKLNGTFKQALPEHPLMSNEQIAISGNFLYSLKDNAYVTAYNLKSGEATLVCNDDDIQPTFITVGGKDTLYIATNKGLYASIKGKKATQVFRHFTESIHSLSIYDNIIYAGGEGIVYAINNQNSIIVARLETADKIKRLLRDNAGDFWCGTFPANKLYHITNNSVNDVSKSLGINGTSINEIYQDHEGNIWVATYGKGVFCLHHNYCFNYTKFDGLENEYVTALQPIGNTLYIGTYDGLYQLNDQGIKKYKQFNGELEYIRNISSTGNTAYITISGINADRIDIAKSNINGTNIQYLHTAFNLIEGDTIYFNHWDGKVWRAIVTPDGIKNKSVIFENKSGLWKRTNVLYRDREKRLWIGTTHGLYILEPDGKTLAVDTGFLCTNISSILQDDGGEVYIGSDKGLAVFDDYKWTASRQVNGKTVESITSLAHDNQHRIWIGTLNGLFILDKDKLLQFDARNILMSDEINALAFDKTNNIIWVGSTFGLSRIDVAQFDVSPIIAPAAVFKTLRTDDSIYRDLGTDSKLELPYTLKNLTLRFSAIQFSAPDGIKFFYKFDDGEWEPTVGRQIEFASIPYGEHVIMLKSVGERGVEGPVATLTIRVSTPFYATTIFKICVAILIGLLVYLILRKRFEIQRNKQQERLELQSKVAELRHQALAASMNPHFIFNALNSIQHFINSHNTEEATDYLAKFARLIRMMLDYGGRTFIPLKDELERLEYYLELEKVRFGEKLNYVIEVDDTLRQSNIEIPNMVIQPVVENALWHGLLPANRKGYLLIKFVKTGEAIRVTVDDDGIGINEGRRRKKKEHNSLGIQMIHERLELLYRLVGYKATLKINDKSDLLPAGQGTFAEIDLG